MINLVNLNKHERLPARSGDAPRWRQARRLPFIPEDFSQGYSKQDTRGGVGLGFRPDLAQKYALNKKKENKENNKNCTLAGIRFYLV